MPGLDELVDQTLIFDKPGGQIIESMALMQEVKPAAVSAYYDQVLPQFGWRKIAPSGFIRADERLNLEFETLNQYNVLKITISPQNP